MRATVVISTLDRPDYLHATIQSWCRGTVLPAEIRVADASDGDATRHVCDLAWGGVSVVHLRCPLRSAAQQRNYGAEGCESELVIFCDDDIEVPPDGLAQFIDVFSRDTMGRIGGVAGMIVGYAHRPPRRLLRWYFALQAGYFHEHYGGHFFGAGINLLPTDRPDDPDFYPSQWLNTTLVCYRTELFARERFPGFAGYSFGEDVNLSARIARSHQLYFHRKLRYHHKGASGSHKADARHLARMNVAHRWHNATTLLGLRGWRRFWKFALALLFDSVSLVRTRPTGWRGSLTGSWQAYWSLAFFRRDPGAIVGESL